MRKPKAVVTEDEVKPEMNSSSSTDEAQEEIADGFNGSAAFQANATRKDGHRSDLR